MQHSNLIDVLVYVALTEEFEYLLNVSGYTFMPYEIQDMALTYYLGVIKSESLGSNYTLMVVPSGKMGNIRAASVVSALLSKFVVRNIVILGIAGSLTADLQPGDVFVPEKVTDYLANSAGVGVETWSFEISGNHFSTDERLLNRMQNFSHNNATYYNEWIRATERAWEDVIEDSTLRSLESVGIQFRSNCKLQAGEDTVLASGPTVVKGAAFAKWIKGGDRKASAVEMESAGVYDSAIIRIPKPRAIAIRGISDFADERKSEIEKKAGKQFRDLAIRNSVSLLVNCVQSGFFEAETLIEEPSPSALKVAPIESRARSIFVIGGITGETAHPDYEQLKLQNACRELGQVLGKSGAQLIVCSPFPDSADQHTVYGYAQSSTYGTIHFHRPNHPDVTAKREELMAVVGNDKVKVLDWLYPAPETNDSWEQAWLLSQIKALDNADAIIAIGGKISNTSNTLLHLAETRSIPILPFNFLGGAAKRAFDRTNWKQLHRNLDVAALGQEKGVVKAIELLNEMIVNEICESVPLQKPKTFFISRSKKDAAVAETLRTYLKSRGYDVLLGDDEIRTDQMVEVSIQRAVLLSDICIVMWSQNYALSPWCYDELFLALRRESRNASRIWLFNLDKSLIVPHEARRLAAINIYGENSVMQAAEELLKRLESST